MSQFDERNYLCRLFRESIEESIKLTELYWHCKPIRGSELCLLLNEITSVTEIHDLSHRVHFDEYAWRQEYASRLNKSAWFFLDMSPNANEAETDPAEAEFPLVDLEGVLQHLNPAQLLGTHIPGLFIRPLLC